MTKIVYNACYGGFSLSYDAIIRYAEIKGITLYPEKDKYSFVYWYTKSKDQRKDDGNDGYFLDRGISRTDPALVQVVEELGEKANGQVAELCIRELSPGIRYRIHEYDGSESVMTIDEYDWEVA